MIVMKFGGSSLESVSAIQRVTEIVNNSRPQRPIVVVSAMGKTTDRLLTAAHQAAKGEDGRAAEILDSLESFHMEAIRTFGTDRQAHAVAEHFQELRGWMNAVRVAGQLTPFLSDAVLSFGERLSSEIVAAALTGTSLDARRLILTDRQHTRAVPRLWETYAAVRRAVAQADPDRIIVLGGFIGSTEEGETTTLGRGGSDWTASLVGAAIQADEIQIWTDVDGVLSCDPRILSSGHLLPSLSYGEAAEMARLGAKVLHPETVAPAIRARIPVTVRNSRRPHVEGTTISLTCGNDSQGQPVKAVTAKSRLTLVRLQALHDAYELPALAEAVFSRYGCEPELFAAPAGNLVAALGDPTHLWDILRDLAPHAAATVERERALVCLVGEEIGTHPELMAGCLKTLGQAGIWVNARIGTTRSLRLLVSEADLPRAMECLHSGFCCRRESESDTTVQSAVLEAVAA